MRNSARFLLLSAVCLTLAGCSTIPARYAMPAGQDTDHRLYVEFPKINNGEGNGILVGWNYIGRKSFSTSWEIGVSFSTIVVFTKLEPFIAMNVTSSALPGWFLYPYVTFPMVAGIGDTGGFGSFGVHTGPVNVGLTTGVDFLQVNRVYGNVKIPLGDVAPQENSAFDLWQYTLGYSASHPQNFLSGFAEIKWDKDFKNFGVGAGGGVY